MLLEMLKAQAAQLNALAGPPEARAGQREAQAGPLAKQEERSEPLRPALSDCPHPHRRGDPEPAVSEQRRSTPSRPPTTARSMNPPAQAPAQW